MKISKHVQSKIEKDYFFVKGNVSLDTEYFINQIEKGIKEENNQNFKTNVKGMMTDWKFFLNDKKFLQFLLPLIQYVDDKYLAEKSYTLVEAWGLKETFSQYTRLHDHEQSIWSGVLYLNDIDQSLVFPDINEEVEAKTGNFAIFSSFIKHRTKNRILHDKFKYGIAFNFDERK